MKGRGKIFLEVLRTNFEVVDRHRTLLCSFMLLHTVPVDYVISGCWLDSHYICQLDLRTPEKCPSTLLWILSQCSPWQSIRRAVCYALIILQSICIKAWLIEWMNAVPSLLSFPWMTSPIFSFFFRDCTYACGFYPL